MNISIRLGEKSDIEGMEKLYYSINDYLAQTVNYTGWRRDVYPAREDAEEGIREGCLYVAIVDGSIAGSFILRHRPEPAYDGATWKKELDYNKVYVIYTFVVHPQYMKRGIGLRLLQFAEEIAAREEVASLRLDVYEKNIPAVKLYEKCGYQYIDTVDLGLEQYGLKWFRLYEKLL